MTLNEARSIAEHACQDSPFPHEQMLAVLIAFGLIKIDEPKEDQRDGDVS